MNCNKCGALMVTSPTSGKTYCSAKCWLQPRMPMQQPFAQPQPYPAQVQAIPQASNVVLNQTDKPNSYEFGPAGQRHKIYYNEIAELIQKIEQLKNAGLVQLDTLEDEE